MIKQFLKIAGVKTEKDFLKKFPTEAAFFKAHPEAEMLVATAMYGGSYAQGGGINNPGFKALPKAVQYNIISNMAYGGYYADGGEAQQAQGQGGGGQQEQVIQFIVQALQQGMAPEQIVQQLTQAGIPQEQGMQLVQAVVQRMQQMQGGQEQQMAAQQGAATQEDQMAEAAPDEAGGAMMKKGGTYYQGTYFADGGSASDCPPGMVYSDAVDDCVPIEGDNQPSIEEERMNPAGNVQIGNPNRQPVANLNMGFPTLFRSGKNTGGLDLSGTFVPGSNLSGNLSGRVPISSTKPNAITFNAGVNKRYNDPELGGMMGSNKVNYNVGLGYQGKLFRNGPDFNVNASFSKKHGGSHKKYKRGGEYEMSEKEIQDLINKGYKIQYL